MLKNKFLMLILICLIGCQESKTVKTETSEISNKREIIQFEDEIIEIELEYYGMMCPCPQWATSKNIERYEKSIKSGNPIKMDSLFVIIEPKDETIANPFDLNYDENNPVFKFRGKFSRDRRKWITEDKKEFNCKVFKYGSCKI